jgi:hypothetical protein
MSLGIHGATPFFMKSNHQTAFNHAFRDESPYEPAKQTKIKCTFCGCWARKGFPCYHCKRSQNGTTMNRPHSSFDSKLEQATPRPQTARTPTVSAHVSRNPETAFTHQFRETSAYNPSAQTKVKCSFCGCWATRGKTCSLCKTFNK